jgi:hypothetical protein
VDEQSHEDIEAKLRVSVVRRVSDEALRELV